MALLLMCGPPCSGKSQVVERVVFELRQERNVSDDGIQILSDNRCLPDCCKNEIYSDSATEKTLRAVLRSEVQRLLPSKKLVIVDSLNYIKGFRYELYCAAKECGSTFCVLYCEVDPEIARSWNASRPAREQYKPEIFNDLVQRFEFPSSSNRWDSPLFVIRPDEFPKIDEIYSALFERSPSKRHQSTVVVPKATVNNLDTLTRDVIKKIMDSQRDFAPGDAVCFSDSQEKLTLNRKITMMELQKLRREFISMLKVQQQRTSLPSPTTDTFICFLRTSIDRQDR